jgi:SAM-dependent methyltransferase
LAGSARGSLDTVTIRDGGLTIAGWALAADAGVMDGFRISCGGRELAPREIATGLPSEDVQRVYPRHAHSDRCRFVIRAALAGHDDATARASLVAFVPLFQGREGKLLIALEPTLPLPPDEHVALIGGTFSEVSVEFLGYLIQLADLRPTDSVLDVGCGPGRIAYSLVHYLAPGGRYDGFDIVERLIGWAQRTITPPFPNFHFRHVDVHNTLYNRAGRIPPQDFTFPYPDASVDLVLLTSVFTHMRSTEVQRYLDEIRRVLKPDGRCLCTCFLLNDESMDLIRAGRSALDIRHPVSGSDCFTTSPQEAEAAIGYEEGALLGWIDRRGFGLIGKYDGSWCGRDQFTSSQDMLILQKP